MCADAFQSELGTAYQPPSGPDEKSQAKNERHKLMRDQLKEKQLRKECWAECEQFGIKYDPSDPAKLREKVWEARELNTENLNEFLAGPSGLGGLPLSVRLLGHMLRTDKQPGSVMRLMEQFRLLRLDVVDQIGMDRRSDTQHYFGLVTSVCTAVKRMLAPPPSSSPSRGERARRHPHASAEVVASDGQIARNVNAGRTVRVAAY